MNNVPCRGCDRSLIADGTIPDNQEAEHPLLYCPSCLMGRGYAADNLIGRRVKIKGKHGAYRVIATVEDVHVMLRRSGAMFTNPITRNIADVIEAETEKGWVAL